MLLLIVVRLWQPLKWYVPLAELVSLAIAKSNWQLVRWSVVVGLRMALLAIFCPRVGLLTPANMSRILIASGWTNALISLDLFTVVRVTP